MPNHPSQLDCQPDWEHQHTVAVQPRIRAAKTRACKCLLDVCCGVTKYGCTVVHDAVLCELVAKIMPAKGSAQPCLHAATLLKAVPRVAGSVVLAGSRRLAGSQSRTGRGVVASQGLPSPLHPKPHMSQMLRMLTCRGSCYGCLVGVMGRTEGKQGEQNGFFGMNCNSLASPVLSFTVDQDIYNCSVDLSVRTIKLHTQQSAR